MEILSFKATPIDQPIGFTQTPMGYHYAVNLSIDAGEEGRV